MNTHPLPPYNSPNAQPPSPIAPVKRRKPLKITLVIVLAVIGATIVGIVLFLALVVGSLTKN